MDSDDEYERRSRGRDKFRRERSDYNDRSGRRDDRSSRREEWTDRRRPVWEGQGRRKEYRDFDRDRRDSGGRHHDISPPMKRVRRDWDNVGGYQGEYGGYNPLMVNQWSSPMEMQPGVHPRPYDNTQLPGDGNSGPTMMSFKQFLNSMEDTIDDMEAVKKYQEYKVEFRKTQIADFFTTHKDEEWFRNKYHPIECVTYQGKVNVAVRKRAVVFLDLLQSGWLQRFSLSVDQGEDIKKLLDAAVIKFEGGSDFDLQILSEPVEQEVKSEPSKENVQPADGDQIASKEINQEQAVSPSSVPLPGTPAPPSATVKNAGFKPGGIKPLEMSDPSPEQLKLREEAEKYHQQQLQQQLKQQEQEKEKQDKKENVPQDQGPVKKRKRKRRHEPYCYDENGETESESESDVESEPAPPGEETAPTDAQERAAEERLLPPGVDTEPISADEAMVVSEDVPPGDDIVPPRNLVKPISPEPLPAEKSKETPVSNEATKMNISEPDQKPPTVEKQEPDKTETDQPKETPLEDKVAEPKDSKTNEIDVKLPSTETKHEEKEGEPSDIKKEEKEEKEQEGEESKMDTTDSTEVKTEPAKEEEEEDGPKPEPIPKVKTPQAFHRTVSLFVRNVPPKIAHNDIASVCSRFPGYMRVVLSEPSPERKFSRRGWITFKPDVNIKDICWTINNIKIKEIELNPIVNRELARRVRIVSGAAVLKELVKADINMATKLIQELDEKFGVWKPTEEEPLKKVEESKEKKTETTVEENNEEKKSEEAIEAVSPPADESTSVDKDTKMVTERKMPKTNPVLELLPAITPDDTPGKKEEAAGKPGDEEGQLTEEGQVAEDGQIAVIGQAPEHPAPVVDDSLVNLLDRLLLYLRVVHSLDYYSGAEYLYEDDMPNRCGIINIRNPLPEKVNYEEVTEWHKNLHQKLDQHLQKKEQIQDEEASLLGKKDQEQEMEKFVQANTQELAKDKWLCPLSGKKFRGPEFVKKHIFNKHADKVEGVKTEVTFFNNFVYDPKRPCEPEVRLTPQGTLGNPHFPGAVSHPVGMQGTMGWGRGVGMMPPGGRGGFGSPHISPNYRSSPDQYNNRGQSYQPKPRRGGSLRRDPRSIVQYKDLDAPGDDIEFF